MKVEIEVEDSVYQVMTTMMLEDHGITLEEFLASYLTQCVAIAAADPEQAEQIGGNVMAIEGMKPLWDRITRKPSDDRS